MVITDTDFADGIAITTVETNQAQEMLASVELEAANTGLCLNSKKTEVMYFNQGGETTTNTKNYSSLDSRSLFGDNKESLHTLEELCYM